jgi:hypothetical protein
MRASVTSPLLLSDPRKETVLVRRLPGLLELDRLLRDLRGRLGQQQQQDLNSTPRPLACVISPHGEEGRHGRKGRYMCAGT